MVNSVASYVKTGDARGIAPPVSSEFFANDAQWLWDKDTGRVNLTVFDCPG
jgi:hypothetical protein